MAKAGPFELFCEEYDRWFEAHPALYRLELKAVGGLVPRGGKGLEVGVGTGRFAGPLGIKTGVEPSERMAARARSRGVEVYSGVAEALPFTDGKFDYLLLATTLCFVNDVRKALSEAYRVLKIGGAVIVGLIDRDSDMGKAYRRSKEHSRFYRSARFLSCAEVTDRLREAGFRDFETRQVIFSGEDGGSVKRGCGEGSFVVTRGLKRKVRTPRETADAIREEIRSLPVQNTPHLRGVRKKYSRLLREESSAFILDLAREMMDSFIHRWIAFEIIRYHPPALGGIGAKELREFGQYLSSWGEVDTFAGLLAGPAWRRGQISDALIHKWARSTDRWRRRAALVSTVPLNRRAAGGKGDAVRTLEVCRLLVSDRDDMVVKALSWALRDLIVHDRRAVERFLREHERGLAGRVKREVRSKLATGLKNPKKGA
ncbi:MAG: DNA alkylation repair protein [Candidatus Krumholzibacteriota bacterium]|nr:DNA alkylation repair protein [Candidatus Krumholzibacteriota bacterium]